MSNLSRMRMIDSPGSAANSVYFAVLLPEQRVALVRNANKGIDRRAFVTKMGGAAARGKRTIKDENCPDA